MKDLTWAFWKNTEFPTAVSQFPAATNPSSQGDRDSRVPGSSMPPNPTPIRSANNKEIGKQPKGTASLLPKTLLLPSLCLSSQSQQEDSCTLLTCLLPTLRYKQRHLSLSNPLIFWRIQDSEQPVKRFFFARLRIFIMHLNVYWF